MDTKEVIFELRTKNGLSQDELAEKVFVTRQAVSRWENGETVPNTETLKLLSKLFGAVGCAVSIAVALVIGQGIVMNIYYQKRQDIDIKGFWWQIIKMSIAPAIITASSYILLRRIQVSSIMVLLLLMAAFAVVFMAGLWLFSMSNYEKSLIKEPIMKILHRK